MSEFASASLALSGCMKVPFYDGPHQMSSDRVFTSWMQCTMRGGCVVVANLHSVNGVFVDDLTVSRSAKDNDT